MGRFRHPYARVCALVFTVFIATVFCRESFGQTAAPSDQVLAFSRAVGSLETAATSSQVSNAVVELTRQEAFNALSLLGSEQDGAVVHDALRDLRDIVPTSMAHGLTERQDAALRLLIYYESSTETSNFKLGHQAIERLVQRHETLEIPTAGNIERFERLVDFFIDYFASDISPEHGLSKFVGTIIFHGLSTSNAPIATATLDAIVHFLGGLNGPIDWFLAVGASTQESFTPLALRLWYLLASVVGLNFESDFVFIPQRARRILSDTFTAIRSRTGSRDPVPLTLKNVAKSIGLYQTSSTETLEADGDAQTQAIRFLASVVALGKKVAEQSKREGEADRRLLLMIADVLDFRTNPSSRQPSLLASILLFSQNRLLFDRAYALTRMLAKPDANSRQRTRRMNYLLRLLEVYRRGYETRSDLAKADTIRDAGVFDPTLFLDGATTRLMASVFSHPFLPFHSFEHAIDRPGARQLLKPELVAVMQRSDGAQYPQLLHGQASLLDLMCQNAWLGKIDVDDAERPTRTDGYDYRRRAMLLISIAIESNALQAVLENPDLLEAPPQIQNPPNLFLLPQRLYALFDRIIDAHIRGIVVPWISLEQAMHGLEMSANAIPRFSTSIIAPVDEAPQALATAIGVLAHHVINPPTNRAIDISRAIHSLADVAFPPDRHRFTIFDAILYFSNTNQPDIALALTRVHLFLVCQRMDPRARHLAFSLLKEQLVQGNEIAPFTDEIVSGSDQTPDLHSENDFVSMFAEYLATEDNLRTVDLLEDVNASDQSHSISAGGTNLMVSFAENFSSEEGYLRILNAPQLPALYTEGLREVSLYVLAQLADPFSRTLARSNLRAVNATEVRSHPKAPRFFGYEDVVTTSLRIGRSNPDRSTRVYQGLTGSIIRSLGKMHERLLVALFFNYRYGNSIEVGGEGGRIIQEAQEPITLVNAIQEIWGTLMWARPSLAEIDQFIAVSDIIRLPALHLAVLKALKAHAPKDFDLTFLDQQIARVAASLGLKPSLHVDDNNVVRVATVLEFARSYTPDSELRKYFGLEAHADVPIFESVLQLGHARDALGELSMPIAEIGRGHPLEALRSVITYAHRLPY